MGWLLSYNTTFDFCFYVSPLVFWHVIFQECFCITVVFLIHEWKLQEAHEELLSFVSGNVSLKNLLLPLAACREKITNVIKIVTLVCCWNHIFQNIETWCKKHGDKAKYMVVSAPMSCYIRQVMLNPVGTIVALCLCLLLMHRNCYMVKLTDVDWTTVCSNRMFLA